jgi:hypothetical protein
MRSVRGRIFVSARIIAGSRFKRFLCFVLIDVRCFRLPSEMSYISQPVRPTRPGTRIVLLFLLVLLYEVYNSSENKPDCICCFYSFHFVIAVFTDCIVLRSFGFYSV